MEKQFIPYEQSLQLKELGFNEKCLAWYLPEIFEKGNITEPILGSFACNFNVYYKDRLNALLWQQAFDWFREKHNLHYIIYKNINIDGYDFCEITNDGIINKNTYSYEEVRLECLKNLIELCKNN